MELDPASLDKVHEIGGEPLVRRLLEMFLELNPVRLEAVRRGVADDDLEAVRSAAHALVSSCGNVGAQQAMGLSRELERAAAAGSRDEVRRLWRELDRVMETLLDVVERRRGESA